MAVNLSTSPGTSALLKSAGEKSPQATGTPQAAGPQNDGTRTDKYDPAKKPIVSFQLDMTSLRDLQADADVPAPCRVGSLGMTSDPGSALTFPTSNGPETAEDLAASNGVTSAMTQLLASLPGVTKGEADIAGQSPPAAVQSFLEFKFPLFAPDSSSAGAVSDHFSSYLASTGGWSPIPLSSDPDTLPPPVGANPCAPVKTKPPLATQVPNPALTQDPRIQAKTEELQSSMLTPKENEKDGLWTAIDRFQRLPDLSIDEQSKFRNDPASRQELMETALTKNRDKFFSNDNPRWANNVKDTKALKEDLVVQSGNGELLKQMKAADDRFANGQRTGMYDASLDLSTTLIREQQTVPAAGGASLNAPLVKATVDRTLGPSWGSALSGMTPLEQATLFSKAVQSDLANAPLSAMEQLKTLDDNQGESFMRAYTYVSPAKVQGYDELRAAPRAQLAREAKGNQLYLQTSGGGTDWGKAIAQDQADRNALQHDLNQAALARTSATAKPPQKTSPALETQKAARDAAIVNAGGVPALNGAPQVPDTFKNFVATKGIDVSHWDTMTRDEKASSVKAAYLFQLAGSALADIRTRPVDLAPKPEPAAAKPAVAPRP